MDTQSSIERSHNSENGSRTKRVCMYVVFGKEIIFREEEFMRHQLGIMHLINNTHDWEYVKIYADRIGEHSGFRKMIEACYAGDIDVIVTKSIRKFAGSIAESIRVADELKALNPPVEIIFTDEAIFSLNSDKLEDLRKVLFSADDTTNITEEKVK